MAQIALFHSVLGIRPGVTEAADRLVAAGHDVVAVDQYDGRLFDDYEQAGGFAESLGYGELMGRAVSAVDKLDDGFIAAGFSNGAGMAQFVATQRPVAGVVLLSGALPLSMLGEQEWPAGVPVQIHYAVDDPFRNQEWLDAAIADIGRRAPVDLFEYAGAGHLFTDASLPGEYNPEASALLWPRVLHFCDTVGAVG